MVQGFPIRKIKSNWNILPEIESVKKWNFLVDSVMLNVVLPLKRKKKKERKKLSEGRSHIVALPF